MEEYTIGLICLWEVAMHMAEAMLDSIHEYRPILQSDSSTYVLGAIGGHNIVIAYAPPFGLGEGSVAIAAKQLLASFNRLRFVLLIGIAGGVPTEDNDIRLGDVVVSSPSVNSGGMDFYRANDIAERTYVQYVGTLKKPPVVLTAAVCRLQSQSTTSNERLWRHLNASSCRVAYGRSPEALTDRLFEAGYGHRVLWKTCNQCDQNRLKARPTRPFDGPVVHYGLIASSDQAIQNGIMRDKIAQKMGNICFETEATGLMAHLPCLVIRGISDYADSHKNDAWQKYASAAAAAYAMELVATISLQQVAETALIASAMANSEQVTQVGRWLASIDVAAQQRDWLAKRTRNTGLWLLESKEFNYWLKGTTEETLWLRGKPGVGKSILCATVIDHLTSIFSSKDDVGIAYLYPDYTTVDNSGPADLLAVLLKQLVQSLDMLPNSLQSLYEIYIQRNERPSFKEFLGVMKSVIRGYSRVFIVIDGLDEMAAPPQDREHILDAILQLQEDKKIHLFTTQNFTEEMLNKTGGIISMVAYADPKDLELYLTAQLPHLMESDIADSIGLSHLVNDIVKATDGIFLRAKLFVDCFARQSEPRNICLAVREFQGLSRGIKGLYEIYDRAMRKIETQEESSQALAKRTLAWIVHANRPLAPTELLEALSTPGSISPLSQNGHMDILTLQSACVGLITIEEHYDRVRLVHFTAQQYFEQRKNCWFRDVDTEKDIVLTCLTYLSSAHIASRNGESDPETQRSTSLPLYNYAAQYWAYHARAVLAEVRIPVLEFLQHDNNVSTCWKVIGDVYPRYFGNCDMTKNATALHLASYFGLTDVVCSLLDWGSDANSMDSHGRTPLLWACVKGHEAIIEVLLKASARLDTRDKNGRTLISWVAELGHQHTLKILLDIGSEDANQSDHDGRTPLSWAAEKCRANIIMLLLATKHVDPEYQDKHGRSPLSWAADKGCTKAVEILLASNTVNHNSRDVDGRTPLWWAAEKGHAEIVTLLVAQHTIQLDSHDKYGQTPLSQAVKQGNIEIVQILQRSGLQKAFQKLGLENGHGCPGNQPDGGNKVQHTDDFRTTTLALRPQKRRPGQQVSMGNEKTPLLPWKQIDQDALSASEDYQMRMILLERQKKRRTHGGVFSFKEGGCQHRDNTMT